MAKEESKVGEVLAWLGMGLSALFGLGCFCYIAKKNPEAAGKFAGAYKRASTPKKKIVEKHEGLFSTYTRVRYE